MKLPDPTVPTPHRELRSLTGIRAFACLWVLVLHLRLVYPKVLEAVDRHWFLAPLRQGFLGVDLFFLLSGFILAYNYSRPGAMIGVKGYMRFLGLRLARIYPVHLFTLMLMIPLLLGSYKLNGKWPEWSGSGSFLANLFLVNGWAIPIAPSWNEPAWSVSAEWFAYLIFPLCLMLTARITTLARAVLFFLGSFAALITLCRMASFPLSLCYGMLRIVFEFAAGCALYQLYRIDLCARWFQSTKADLVLLFCIAATYAAAIVYPATIPSQVGLVPVLAVALYALAWGGGGFSRFLSTPAAEFGGHASYSVYMVQFPCQLVMNKVVHFRESSSLLTQSGMLVLDLLVIIVAGLLTHLYVEVPARKFCRRFAQRLVRNRVPDPTAAQPYPATPVAQASVSAK